MASLWQAGLVVMREYADRVDRILDDAQKTIDEELAASDEDTAKDALPHLEEAFDDAVEAINAATDCLERPDQPSSARGRCYREAADGLAPHRQALRQPGRAPARDGRDRPAPVRPGVARSRNSANAAQAAPGNARSRDLAPRSPGLASAAIPPGMTSRRPAPGASPRLPLLPENITLSTAVLRTNRIHLSAPRPGTPGILLAEIAVPARRRPCCRACRRASPAGQPLRRNFRSRGSGSSWSRTGQWPVLPCPAEGHSC